MLDRKILDTSRFNLDNPKQFGISMRDEVSGETELHARFLSRHVQVSEVLFPKVAKSIEGATRWLLGDREVHAFVSSDENMNALCMPGPQDLPLIWLSSGLVKGLNDLELRFVIGHELGHWYYQHYRYPEIEPNAGPLFVARQQLSRAAEVSADRFGLIACGDIDVALRAILKTASGLPEEHIGVRVSEFISQAKSLKVDEIDQGEVFATHPPMVIRARALLWFSMSKEYTHFTGGVEEGALDIEVVNKRVEKDLTSVLGEGFIRRQQEEIQDAIFWMALCEMMADGKLSREEQGLIQEEFGGDVLQKIKGFVQGKSADQVRNEIREKAEEAKILIAAYSKTQIKNLMDSKRNIALHAMKFMSHFNQI
ncbi:M48 family metallopeptidase [Pseudomonadota bacterium]